MNENEPLMK